MSSEGDCLLLYKRAGSGLPKRELRAFAGRLRDEVAGGRLFTCLFTDDRELERLNRMFLSKDSATDVLSFPSAGTNFSETRAQRTAPAVRESRDSSAGARRGSLPVRCLGEMAISVQRAAQQAAEHDHATADELKILMLHGLLHLLGHDHEADRGGMGRLEKRWRRELSLPEGLIERSRRKSR